MTKSGKNKAMIRAFLVSMLSGICILACGGVHHASAADYEYDKNLLKDATVFGDGIVEGEVRLPVVTLINGASANTRLCEEIIVDGNLFNSEDTPKFGTSSSNTDGAIRIKLNKAETVSVFVLTTRKDKNGYGIITEPEKLTFGYGNKIGGYGLNGFAERNITVKSHMYGNWQRITLTLDTPVTAEDILIGGIKRDHDINIVETELYKAGSEGSVFSSVSVAAPRNGKTFSAGTKKIRVCVSAYDAIGAKIKSVDFFGADGRLTGNAEYNPKNEMFEYIMRVSAGNYEIYASAAGENNIKYLTEKISFSVEYDVKIRADGKARFSPNESVTLTAAVQDRYNTVAKVSFEHNGEMTRKVTDYYEHNGYKYYSLTLKNDDCRAGGYIPYAYDSSNNLICEAQSVFYYIKGYSNVAFSKNVSAVYEDRTEVTDSINSRVSSLTDGRIDAYEGKNGFTAYTTEGESIIFEINLENIFEISDIMIFCGETDKTKIDNLIGIVDNAEVYYLEGTQWKKISEVTDNKIGNLIIRFTKAVSTDLLRIKVSAKKQFTIREVMVFSPLPISMEVSSDNEKCDITVINSGIFDEKCSVIISKYREGKLYDVGINNIFVRSASLLSSTSQWGNDACLVPGEYRIKITREEYDCLKIYVLRDIETLKPIVKSQTIVFKVY